ncbi:TrmB family transcriptional regulator [Candidatus Woesearchaeota archaeon]|nr:MAG: TrmB family transcriptional regulator [Candidatus Woesearchaeota archaeon]
MIVQESFLKKLKSAFDLNIYEVKIWTALLSRGVATAGELADISGVPRSRSYDVLESLEKKGFVVMELSKPIKYVAIHPEEVISRVKTSIQKKAEEQISELDELKDKQIYKEIELLHKQGIEKIDPTNISGLIKSRKNIYDQLKSMITNAKESVLIVTTDSGLQRKSDALKTALNKAKKKGVDLRILSNIDAKSIPKNILKLADIRVNKSKEARFVITDNEQILLMLNHDRDVHENYDVAVWLKSPFFASTLKDMVDKNWNKLKPLN